jgi:DNA repair photolyase
MTREIQAKSILRRHRKIDSWFMTHYGMNLYRGCSHDCVYCDGRAETYNVQGDFAAEVSVKANAIDLLERELDPCRKRKPMPKSFMMLGGGVCDAYQPIERKYRLTRGALEIIYRYGYPVHILTKSTLVERDTDLLLQINRQSRAVVSFSFSSTDDRISALFEPGSASPAERLKAIARLKAQGIACGMFLLPVIPFITDTPGMIERSLRMGKESGADFVIFGPMTLKAGRQKDHFMKALQKHFPELVSRYHSIYPSQSTWGAPGSDYSSTVHSIFDEAASRHKLPKRMPPGVFGDVIDDDDLIIVILEHLDYLLHLKSRLTPYGYAAYALSKLKTPVRELSSEELLQIRGIGPATARIIREIIETGACSYYERLL